MKKILLLSFIFSFLLLVGCGQRTEVVVVNQDANTTPVIPAEAGIQDGDETAWIPSQAGNDNGGARNDSAGEMKQVEVPSKLDLAIPFVSQAPLRNWDSPYDEACEEASMLSVAGYLNKSPLDFGKINDELLALMDWEEKNGYRIDVDAEEVVKILKNYFNLESRLETEVTIDRIKYELAQGNPIIIPTSGRTLGNPYFKVPGPIYHMLVIRGYDSKNFITNDVCTNTKGEAYKYRYQVIIDSIHDWDHAMMADNIMTDAEMVQGKKVMIVIGK